MYWPQRWELLTFTAEAGRPVLPDLVLWAFSLNEGDLLAVSREESERFRCRFRSYGERVWTVSEDYSHPWPFIEEMLRLPLAAVGPQGALWLPRQAAALALRPRDPLLLCVDPDPVGTGFTLEPAAGGRVTPRLFLHATYRLPVEAGCRVRLPEDVLWVLDLQAGDRLACETSLATADFEPLASAEPLRGRNPVELGPEGGLSLPESLLRDLKPNAQARLTLTFSPEPTLRLTPWVGIE